MQIAATSCYVSPPVTTPASTLVRCPVSAPMDTPVNTPVSTHVRTPVNTPAFAPLSTPVLKNHMTNTKFSPSPEPPYHSKSGLIGIL